jgi:hypothetical protein
MYVCTYVCMYVCMYLRDETEKCLDRRAWLPSVKLHSVVRQKFTDVSEVLPASQESVNFYDTTWRNIPEGSHIHVRFREDLKSDLTWPIL